MQPQRGYEQSAHLYDRFDTKENIAFFHHYAAEAGDAASFDLGRTVPAAFLSGSFDHLLDETGFAVRREWRDYDFTPYEAGDALLIVEAVKV